MIFSSNGGVDWVVQTTGNSASVFTSIFMVNDNTGYIAGGDTLTGGVNGRIRRTVNGGTSWDSLGSPTNNKLMRFEFVNSTT